MGRPLPKTSAEIERLLMRWPLSIHLKIELKKAQVREARQLRRVRSRLMGRIKGRLKALPIEHLRLVEAQLEQLQEVAHEAR